jgi:polysaccharide deacetylase 2 family uncharacterized protein YibQ
MNRRKFLLKSTVYMFGSICGLNTFSKVFAASQRNAPVFSAPRMALIIDDIGFSRSRARQFLELGVPLTFSILPRLVKTHKIASEIHARGHEIMLHQPMEPYNADFDPGPGALYVGDGTAKIAGIMVENIKDIPFAIGVNNHMGSRLTASPKEINDALGVVKKRGLFFVDSLTSSRSMAYATAKRLKITAAYRNIFLDNIMDEAAILCQLHKLENNARSRGHAIGIGHPFPETAMAIAQFIRDRRGSGVPMVHISRVLA